MRRAAWAAVICAAALAGGCNSESSPGFKQPRVLAGTIHRVDTDRLARELAVSIDFVSADRGFLATQGDRVLRTSDGGLTWATAGARINHLAKLDFVTARRGYAITQRDVLIATRDAGESWQRVHRFPSGRIEKEGTTLVFVDAEHGWVVPSGGPIYRTRDSGRTWERLPFPCGAYDHPVGPAFVDERNGYVVCGGQPATIMQFKALYVTLDGGDTWQPRAGATLFSERPDHELPSVGHAHDLDFRSTEEGLILSSRAGIDRTDTGGLSWKRILDTDDADTVADVAWPTPRRIFAVLFRAGVLRSDDRGRHWRRVYPAGAGAPAGPIVFFSATDGIGFGAESILGGQRVVMATSDGGQTWQRRSDVSHVKSVQQVFRFGSTVLATDGSTLLRSEDKGRHWRRVFTVRPPRFGWFSFPSADVGFLADDAHRLFRTDDGGSTWRLVNRKTRELQGVVFVSPRSAFVVDYDTENLLRTVDSGKKWRRAEEHLLKTDNAGERWRAVQRSFGIVLGIHRLDDNHWWIFANADCGRVTPCKGQVWRTSDGGRDWDLIRLPETLDAQTLSFVSQTVGFAGSPSSGLYRTEDGGVTWSYVYPR